VLGAPDLAITQFLVETLFVVLIILVLPQLPTFAQLTSPGARARDMVLALSVGAGFAVLAYWASPPAGIGPLPEYFALHSYSEAHGRNVVNVILVDFRALDTLGEITVLGVAAIGVWALVKFRRQEERDP
jgi:multicomponent Na+:H+ antiporter subunit A